MVQFEYPRVGNPCASFIFDEFTYSIFSPSGRASFPIE